MLIVFFFHVCNAPCLPNERPRRDHDDHVVYVVNNALAYIDNSAVPEEHCMQATRHELRATTK